MSARKQEKRAFPLVYEPPRTVPATVDLEEISQRVRAFRQRTIQFRERLCDLISPLKELLAELEEIESTFRDLVGDKRG